MNEPFMLPPGIADAPRIAAAFATNGVVVLPGQFSPAELAPIRLAIETWSNSPAADPPVRTTEFERHQTNGVGWLPVAEGRVEFAALRGHAHLTAVTTAAIGADASDNICLVMLSRSGQGQAWHQDTASVAPGQFLINRLIYPWDVDARAGSVIVVPGSHRTGTIPPGDPHGHIPGEVALAPAAGTLVLLHSRCWHRVTRNESAGPRISVNFRCQPFGAETDLGRYGVYRTGTYDFARDAAAEVA